jgi:SAM-dependent methyltransferase
MTAAPAARILLFAAALFTTAAQAEGPAAKQPYQPQVGQSGKDVVWMPTADGLANKMLDMARVTKKDYVIDLGSGDGRTVIAAARRGATALGIEYNEDLVELSKQNAAKAGVSARAKFVKADIFESDFSRATVITMFLLPELNRRLRPAILELKPGTRIVSNTFDMGDWEPDGKQEMSNATGCDSSYCTALLWIVPAKVAGTHKTAKGELVLEQQYQVVTGTLNREGKSTPVKGKVIGSRLELVADGKPLRAKVVGQKLQLI